MAQRPGRSLLGWVNGVDLKPLFLGSSVEAPRDYDKFKQLWRQAQGRAGALPPVPPVEPSVIMPLPQGLAKGSADLIRSELYQQNYDHLQPPAQIASVPLDRLVAPQWWADGAYVEELVSQTPPIGDDDSLFRFCFPVGRLGRPAVSGGFGNVVDFVGPRRDIGIPGPIVIERYTGSKVHLGFEVMARPNFVFVAYVRDASRLIVLNGVHHLAALRMAGHTRAFCILLVVPNVGEVGFDFGRPEIFKPNRLLAQRPPMVVDYFDPDIGDNVSIRAMDQRLRITLNFELGTAPKVEDHSDTFTVRAAVSSATAITHTRNRGEKH
jgi:hypothetical protein